MSDNEQRLSWNQQIIAEFRANGGHSAQFPDTDLVLLHHTGAKSGAGYVSPLAGFAQPDGGWAIMASNGGRDNNPAWFHNLQANPSTVLEVPGDGGVRTVKVTARVAESDERDRLFVAVTTASPRFAGYQEGTSRQIPIVVLELAS